MDLKKIGKFIAENRKKIGLSQEALAEKLDISNRSISKWERGICLPDTSKMPELCKLFGTTINDLFSGEVVDMKTENEKLNENLLSLAREKEHKDKQLLLLEWVIIGLGIITTSALYYIVYYTKGIPEDTKTTITILGFIISFVAVFSAIKIEQTAGYYKCKHCGHKHTPTFTSIFFAIHIGYTRYMKCPKCGKHSWQKKVF